MAEKAHRQKKTAHHQADYISRHTYDFAARKRRRSESCEGAAASRVGEDYHGRLCPGGDSCEATGTGKSGLAKLLFSVLRICSDDLLKGAMVSVTEICWQTDEMGSAQDSRPATYRSKYLCCQLLSWAGTNSDLDEPLFDIGADNVRMIFRQVVKTRAKLNHSAVL